MNHYDRVCATVNLDAVRNNILHMKANIAEGTQIIAVIKTDGYGHGAIPIAHELEPLTSIQGFATATVEEASILRKSGIRKPILILGYTFPYCYETLVREEFRPAVFQLEAVKQLSDIAQSLHKILKIHVKVDTGMNRIGIMPDECGIDFVKSILSLPNIEIEGIFTHFARADECDKTFALLQLKKFEDFIREIENRLEFKIPIKHCSNSAGIVELKEANMDAVRAGITLYGMWPSGEVDQNIVALQPVLGLKSTIVNIKTVGKGAAISYGGTYVTEKEAVIATIPVGYGDGYPRALSNKGYILIRGKRAAITGRICMDQFMVDVSDIPEAKVGDEVTLIGTEDSESITIEQLADISGGFNYELACNLGKRVPRVYTKNGIIVHTKDYFEDIQ